MEVIFFPRICCFGFIGMQAICIAINHKLGETSKLNVTTNPKRLLKTRPKRLMACFHHNPISGTQICVIPNPGFRFERPSKLKPLNYKKYAISLTNNLFFFSRYSG